MNPLAYASGFPEYGAALKTSWDFAIESLHDFRPS